MTLDTILVIVVSVPSLFFLTKVIFAAFPEVSLPKTRFSVIRDPNYTPTIAVLIPSYNEGKTVYETIRHVWESDYPKDKLKIYPQDDGSVDDTWKWIQKAGQDFDRVYVEQNPENRGKTHTYLRAMERSESEIIMNVDSDTWIGSGTIRSLMSCLGDKRLGVVGTPAGLINANDTLLTALQAFMWVFFNGFITNMESRFRANQVIGGYAIAIRRAILEDIAPAIRKRHWLGLPVKDGEDRFITHQALLRGWGTYYDQSPTGIVKTFAMDTYAKYWGQQVRWRRSAYRIFMWVARTPFYHFPKLNPVSMWTIFIQGCAISVMFLFMVILAMSNPMALLSPARIMAILGIGAALILLWDKHMKYQDLRNPLKMALVIPWGLVNAFFLTIAGLMTLDQDAWGNRTKKISGEKQ